MLTTLEQAEQYQSALKEYLELHKSDISACVKTMAKQIGSTLLGRRDFSFPTQQSTYYNDQLLTIKNLLSSPIDEITIEHTHFELAKTLRYISALGSTPDFSTSPIVQFYIHPKFEETLLSRIDEITFGVAYTIYRERTEYNSRNLDENIKKIETWSSNIDQWEKRATEAEDRYREVTSGNNYLGLSHAFDKIVESKRKEASGLLSALKIAGALALSLPLIQLLAGITLFLFKKETTLPLLTLTFSIAVEIILIYYFRLIHSRWAVLKNQISQLELRSSMCAFVHDYAAKSKDLERETLMKFENMIFSEVISDNAPPPSIYDAADSIAKLLGAWKKPV